MKTFKEACSGATTELTKDDCNKLLVLENIKVMLDEYIELGEIFLRTEAYNMDLRNRSQQFIDMWLRPKTEVKDCSFLTKIKSIFGGNR